MNKTMIVNPEPGQMMLTGIVSAVDAGKITIPKFQRKFVWSPVDVASLFDSIFKGYPIGTFTLWQTKDRLCPIKEVGGHKLPEPKKGEMAEYVLDGQQRLTSIYACLKAIAVGKYDYSKIYVRLTDLNEEDDQLVVTEVGDPNSTDYITIRELIDLDLEAICDRYKKKSARSRISDFHKRLLGYQLPVIRLTDVSLAKATEIFTRINTTGKSLSLFEIISAKVYDPDRKFDLLDRRKEQRDKWMSANYGTISDSTVLEAISICVKDEVDHVVNITIVDQYLNQKEIRVKAPSEYMKRYAKNKKIKQIMATHLIGDFDRFGIWCNDYDKFFKGRVLLLQKAVKDRIIAQKGDVLK